MQFRKILLYYTEWLLPLTTGPLYLLLNLGWGWFPSYIVASFIGGTLFFPVNKYIFKGCSTMKIYHDGKEIYVKECDRI